MDNSEIVELFKTVNDLDAQLGEVEKVKDQMLKDFKTNLDKFIDKIKTFNMHHNILGI